MVLSAFLDERAITLLVVVILLSTVRHFIGRITLGKRDT